MYISRPRAMITFFFIGRNYWNKWHTACWLEAHSLLQDSWDCPQHYALKVRWRWEQCNRAWQRKGEELHTLQREGWGTGWEAYPNRRDGRHQWRHETDIKVLISFLILPLSSERVSDMVYIAIAWLVVWNTDVSCWEAICQGGFRGHGNRRSLLGTLADATVKTILLHKHLQHPCSCETRPLYCSGD